MSNMNRVSVEAGFGTEDVPNCLIHELFFRQASRDPGRIAVFSENRSLSYAVLLQESQVWAKKLRQLGVKPNTLVAVVMQKGWEQVVAVLGILASGAAYLPIDPGVPVNRLHYLLDHSNVQIALTQSWIDSKLEWPPSVKRFSVDTAQVFKDKALGVADCLLEPSQTPDDLAYVLYTSGSTGNPKGVMIAHRGIVNCILETNRTFQVREEDRVLAVTALHHDMSVYDLFGPLAAGGTIVIPSPAGTRSPDHWLNLIERYQITVWNSVPGFMEMLLEYAAAQKRFLHGRLRLAFLGGDWIPLSAPARIRKHFGEVNIVSVGGPTETTVWNIWYPIKDVQPEWQSIPYGHPIAHTRYYILDEQLRDCPPGTAGELYCAGIGLLQGYWRDEEQTRQRCVVHPYTGERIFRTGDRGSLLPDGEIQFLGRLDSQVKINGQRIELGEIEMALLRSAGVKQAATKVVDCGARKYIAAYVVFEPGVTISAEELRWDLEASLPSYMVPFIFLTLPALPLNSNGKVERSALPAPPLSSVDPDQQQASQLEQLIAGVWSRVLARPAIDLERNFFDLGADSLSVVQAHAELEQALRRNLSITELFEFPSVRALSKHLEGGHGASQQLFDAQQRAMRQRNAFFKKRIETR